MAHDQFKAFLEAVSTDTSLQEKLNSVETDAEFAAVIAIAKETGFTISAEELNGTQQLEESDDVELSDDELGAVAGGSGGKRMWLEGLAKTNGWGRGKTDWLIKLMGW